VEEIGVAVAKILSRKYDEELVGVGQIDDKDEAWLLPPK
jgi:hypothetical protein